MYKFYASMDLKKENTFDLEYLQSTIDLREFVRFGYQQKIIPSFITPDEMVFVFKCMLSESYDNYDNKDKDNKKKNSGVIDYDQFTYGLVRISIIAQAKLGGVDKDALQTKLDKETKNNTEAEEQKKKAKEKYAKKQNREQEEMSQLKEQF